MKRQEDSIKKKTPKKSTIISNNTTPNLVTPHIPKTNGNISFQSEGPSK